jgi:DNA-binding CsgD family transcriptional regulator
LDTLISQSVLVPIQMDIPVSLSRSLTNREIEVLTMLANGLQRKQIAVRLRISDHGVGRRLLSARLKLGAQTREHAVALAVIRGFIQVEI